MSRIRRGTLPIKKSEYMYTIHCVNPMPPTDYNTDSPTSTQPRLVHNKSTMQFPNSNQLWHQNPNPFGAPLDLDKALTQN